MNPTPEQLAAIHTLDQNLIVVAGAGSGKTRVLVERFLALLEQYPTWPLNSLVAITFTHKAAQEMRDRLRQEMEARRLQAPDDSESAVWKQRIGELPGARIDTIHGLCASILRANAAEAGIDPGFAVLDDVQAMLLREDVVDSVLAEVAQAADVPERTLLSEYEIRAVKQALLACLYADWGDLPDDPFAKWLEDWKRHLEQVLARWLDSPRLADALSWSPEDGWPATPDKISDLFQRVKDGIECLRQPDEPLSRYRALDGLCASLNLQGGSKKAWGGSERLKQAKKVLGSIQDLIDEALQAIGLPPGDADRRAAELLPLWAALARRAQAAYQQAKLNQSPSVLDFDDLERLAHALLQSSAEVRARYQNAEFKHLLVDEFQDTNQRQWEIVCALADPQHPGSLFVVGDPKQSIYEFRGADVRVFEQARRVIVEKNPGRELPLSQSFRAHAPLVERLNAIFAGILRRDGDSPTAEFEVELGHPMTAARLEAPSDAPLIELLLVDKERLDPSADDKAETARRWEAYVLAERLRLLVDEKRLVYDRQSGQTRPITYGDMAMLFQALTDVVLYEEALKAAGIPYVTVSGRGYYDREEVWDVLNLLRALHDPADELALAAALRSPLFGLSDDALLSLRRCIGADGRRLPLAAALQTEDVDAPEDERARMAFARQCFDGLRQMAGRATLADLIRAALARTGYLATLTGLPDGARRRGNVEKLLRIAESSGQIMLGAFDAYLRDLSELEVREGEALVEVEGAVTLMSVHASKGLEFPLVALVDVSRGWRKPANSAPLLVDRELGLVCKTPGDDGQLVETFAYRRAEELRSRREQAEKRRQLYVAMTRAQDYLLISGQFEHYRDTRLKPGSWLSWLIPALLPETDDLSPGERVYADRSVRLVVPEQMPELAPPERRKAASWERPEVQQGAPLPGPTQAPPLVKPLRAARDGRLRHLTATQLADLGSACVEAYHRERFRRSVLQDAPAQIERVSGRRGGVSQRLVGEMVHRVLRWQFPDERDNVEAVLRSYAWQLGIVAERQQAEAVQTAKSLLDRMRASDVAQWLRSAARVYRELPFVYRTERRIIHGVLDVLFQRPDGSWAIVDYKSSLVSGYAPGQAGSAALAEHARRFHLQVGMYAAAVRDQLQGVTPDVYIEYIRYGTAVQVPTAAWEAALSQLETEIGRLIGEEDRD